MKMIKTGGAFEPYNIAWLEDLTSLAKIPNNGKGLKAITNALPLTGRRYLSQKEFQGFD